MRFNKKGFEIDYNLSHKIFIIFLIVLILSLTNLVSAIDYNAENDIASCDVSNMTSESSISLSSSKSINSENDESSNILTSSYSDSSDSENLCTSDTDSLNELLDYDSSNLSDSTNTILKMANGSANVNVYNVYSNMTNDEIQFIFDNANDGDTIKFINKSYENISIIVDKHLNIISSKNTIIYSSNGLTDNAKKLGISDSFCFYFTNESSLSLIKGFTFKGNADYAIIVEGASNISIVNNTISNGKKAGIYINNSKYNTIKNNTIKNLANDGIYISNTNRSSIDNNKIFSNGNIGVNLYNVVLVNLTDNKIYKNNLDGVLLNNTKSCWILNNTIINNSISGIRMEGSTIRNHIQYNNISSNVINIYANSITTSDEIKYNTLMYAKASSKTYTTVDNTGSAICFADNFTSSSKSTMDFSYNTVGFNEYWDAKSTMSHPSVNIGSNWYFDNDGEYSVGHICPMVFGGALSPEDFKHLSMGFNPSGEGLIGQLFDGDNPVGAGKFSVDNININGVDYGSAEFSSDGKAYIDISDIPSGSNVTITVNGHSFTVTVGETIESNQTSNQTTNQSKTNQETSKNQNLQTNSNTLTNSTILQSTNGTGSGNNSLSGSGSGNNNFTGSGISVGEDSGQTNSGTSDSGENGAGSSSSSQGITAYELSPEELSSSSAKNSQWLALAGVLLVLLIIALGYRKKDNKFEDDGDYSL